MKEDIEKIREYFCSILGIDNIRIMTSRNFQLDERDNKAMIELYFNRKKLYFDVCNNTLYTFCPVPSGALRVHDEIVTLECDDYFKWVILYKAFGEDYLKGTVCTEIRKVSKNENILLDVPNKEKVENFLANAISTLPNQPTNVEMAMIRAFSRLD